MVLFFTVDCHRVACIVYYLCRIQTYISLCTSWTSAPVQRVFVSPTLTDILFCDLMFVKRNSKYSLNIVIYCSMVDLLLSKCSDITASPQVDINWYGTRVLLIYFMLLLYLVMWTRCRVCVRAAVSECTLPSIESCMSKRPHVRGTATDGNIFTAFCMWVKCRNVKCWDINIIPSTIELSTSDMSYDVLSPEVNFAWNVLQASAGIQELR